PVQPWADSGASVQADPAEEQQEKHRARHTRQDQIQGQPPRPIAVDKRVHPGEEHQGKGDETRREHDDRPYESELALVPAVRVHTARAFVRTPHLVCHTGSFLLAAVSLRTGTGGPLSSRPLCTTDSVSTAAWGPSGRSDAPQAPGARSRRA